MLRPARVVVVTRRRRVATRPKSLYDALGVSKTASQDEIKKAYRKLVRECHPDKNPGDKEADDRFKEVQGAYDVLSDPDKRKQYDAFGSADGRGPRAGNFNFGEAINIGDLGDLFGGFGDIFGGGGPALSSSAPAAAPISRPRSGCRSRTSAARDRDPHSGRGRGRLPRLWRRGDGRRVAAQGLPRVQGARGDGRESGLLRDLAARPPLRRTGTIVENPCRHCGGSGR